MGIACLDVHYPETGGARAAAVVLADWVAATALEEPIATLEKVEPYQPGAFYRRELPCLLAVLGLVRAPLEGVVVDGYVWLDDQGRAGLGAHLYAALGERVPVIGVAKTRFGAGDFAEEVLRGESERPLFVTAAGVDRREAARRVGAMHGAARLPWALQRADRRCRTG